MFKIADATSDIYIDSELKGTGTWSGRLNKGAYNVECRKANHKSTFETITIEDFKANTKEWFIDNEETIRPLEDKTNNISCELINFN